MVLTRQGTDMRQLAMRGVNYDTGTAVASESIANCLHRQIKCLSLLIKGFEAVLNVKSCSVFIQRVNE